MWDHTYRRLDEGEIIRETDGCLTDSHLGWRRDNGRCAGKPAPNPSYTSHRIYRRKRACPICGIAWHYIRLAHAKIVFAKTRLIFRLNRRNNA